MEELNSTNSENDGFYEIVTKSLPSNATPIVKESLLALQLLPGLSNWNPEPVDWTKLVKWGFPFTFFSRNTSVGPIQKSIGKAIAQNNEPEATKFSEISAAALMVGLGADSVEQIPEKREKDLRTPDFRVGWNDEFIELEVTRANQKQPHIERQRLAEQLVKDLRKRKYSWDIIVHFTEVLSQADVAEILKASDTIMPGNYAEIPNRWRLIAKYPDRSAGVLLVAGEREKTPNWWSTGLAEACICAGAFDDLNATKPNPQVNICFGIPVSTYINPLWNKADHNQGSGTIPFVVAVDVYQLSNAFSVFRSELPNCFPTWQQISAVLVFMNWCSPIKVGWTSELIVNPYANNPLPKAVLEQLRFNDGRVNIWANLTEQE